ncbi:MAG TPA: hypothetical protein VM140_04010 [Burkholderiales bacterium]|nr:hypothetical protein [Burkholderiales bacterium]
MPPFSRRIIVAAVPIAALRIQRALADQDVFIVRTITEAAVALKNEAFRLAIFGLYFDESRMFELSTVARASELNRATPILCVQGLRRLTAATVRGLEQTIRAMGYGWLDIAAIADDEAGTALLRESILRHLPPDPFAAGGSGPGEIPEPRKPS